MSSKHVSIVFGVTIYIYYIHTTASRSFAAPLLKFLNPWLWFEVVSNKDDGEQHSMRQCRWPRCRKDPSRVFEQGL